MSKERELLESCLDEMQYHEVPCQELITNIKELLAQPEQDILQGQIESGLRVIKDKEREEPIGEIVLSGNTTAIGAPFPAVKWITGVMPAIGTKLYTEQDPVFNFNLERMKWAVESPVSDVTVEELMKQVKSNRMFYQEGYAQAELDSKREPLGDERLRDLSNSINNYPDFGNVSVWQAFYIARLIEKAHGIGGEE